MIAPAAARAALADAVRAAADGSQPRRLVLAVSGGRDSMAMLHAFSAFARQSIAAVATMDHGTGAHAAAATRAVAEWCAAREIPFTSTRLEASPASEAAWRDARWRFLRAVAAEREALVATAHTRDDNVETILMRELRGSGARGLAALYASGDVVRPLLDLSRDDVARYAEAEAIRWTEDPSNDSRAYLRNRIRHEILPALLAVRPTLGDELLDIARRAAEVRRAIDDVARTFVGIGEDRSLSVATAPLGDYDQEALCVLWPAIAARGGIILDRRGTAGLARFTKGAAAGDRMQLSGAIEVVRLSERIVLRYTQPAVPDPAPLAGPLAWGRWRFVAGDPAMDHARCADPWSARLPLDVPLIVRAWREGDRMHGAGDAAPRRVKRFLSDAGVAGTERRGWPVVVCGEDVVWIPGVRRSDAATDRSGRPEAVYVSERTER
jgi:tRNA(Ile)-lysidine synthase